MPNEHVEDSDLKDLLKSIALPKPLTMGEETMVTVYDLVANSLDMHKETLETARKLLSMNVERKAALLETARRCALFERSERLKALKKTLSSFMYKEEVEAILTLTRK